MTAGRFVSQCPDTLVAGFEGIYVIMYGVKRTTVYLPEDLKARLEAAARSEGRTEADLIRQALGDLLGAAPPPRPRLPLIEPTGVTTNWAERVDELLVEGYGSS
ncbi:MAG TPA: CopG family transcriptional regulator [Acidimicrobiia bacterium]